VEGIVQAPVVVVLLAAAVATVGAGLAVAGRTTSSDDLTRLRPAASAEVMVQTCTAWRPMGRCWKVDTRIRRGESAGRFWAAIGNERITVKGGKPAGRDHLGMADG
jgi:hypothetical protein